MQIPFDVFLALLSHIYMYLLALLSGLYFGSEDKQVQMCVSCVLTSN